MPDDKVVVEMDEFLTLLGDKELQIYMLKKQIKELEKKLEENKDGISGRNS